ncbi:hypothetical protein N0X72_25635 [Streptomyces carpaticus]|uniref:hypothetical protein n=1 Tax=Streptomyces TaxID=1883 RepID=UPI0022061F1E|nr:hypothetical protein N0X72_25635 [Streptomyces carpaticus]
MSRGARWGAAVGVSAAAFGVVLWAVAADPFGWLPEAEEVRWAVATAFAGAVAGAVGTAVAWWAGRETAAPPRAGVGMTAVGEDRSRITQRVTHAGAGEVSLDARGSGDAEISQSAEERRP